MLTEGAIDDDDLATHRLDFGDPSIADEWLYKGAKSLSAFWRPDEACFLRATGPALVRGEEVGATSSNRAFLATTEILFHLVEEGLSLTDGAESGAAGERWVALFDELAGVWRSMASQYYGKSIEWLRDQSDNGRNDFTDAHLLVSEAILCSRFAEDHLGFVAEADRRRKLEDFVREYEDKIESNPVGARIADSGPTHPFLTLYAIRAIEVARHVTGPRDGRSRVTDTLESAIRDAATDDAFRQIGMHAAREARFDPAALMGDIALLHRFAGMSGRRLVETGVELIRDTQQPDGSWKTEILTGDRKLVYLPSLDLAVGLANLVLADLTEGSDRLARIAIPTLERSLDFVEAGYWESPPRAGRPTSGWTNDQARQPGVVESWSTALALQLQLRVKRIARRLNQHVTLARYRTTYRDRHRREWLRWPDLAGPIALVRSAEAEMERARRDLARISDPSEGAVVDRAVWTEIVHPILCDSFDRPGKTRSFFLYGPPGTRKSSMVGAIAAALDWPLVTLAPPDFLTSGISGLEARAEEIFRDLLELRRVVVFFDECEELFRRRTVINAPEHRTQSDFITSGMLPRLQDLRDRRWLLYAIATNTEMDEIDPAVVRLGRIDGQQRIGHPTVDAQIRYLRNKGVAEDELKIAQAALARYDEYLDREHKPSRADLDEERKKLGDEFRQDSGNLKDYFTKVDAVRAREAELPHVSFGVLDALSREMTGKAEDQIFDRVKNLAATRGRPRQWTEVYVPSDVDLTTAPRDPTDEESVSGQPS